MNFGLEKLESSRFESTLAYGATVREFLGASFTVVEPAPLALQVEDIGDVTLRAGGRSGYYAHAGIAPVLADRELQQSNG
jgi:hypothetical protein